MALEPAGVSLEAEGFREYLRRLEAIDKKQREVFDTKFKDTQLSLKQVTAAAKRYEKELKDLAKAERRARDEATKFAQQQKIVAATQRQAALSTLELIKGFGQFSIENAKLAAQFQASQTGLNNLAASFGQSGDEIRAAIVRTSRGTLSNLKAMQTANEALLLGVARTPEEFERFTRAALVLGRTVGISASESISRFTTALGRESLLRLDDFGAKASEVNAEIERLAQAELGKLPDQLTKAEKSAIFIQAALNVTGENVEKIGEDAAFAASSFERLEASTENLRVTLGEVARPFATGIAEALSEAAVTAQKFFSFLTTAWTFQNTIIKDVFGNIGRLLRGEATKTLDEILIGAAEASAARFKEVAGTIAGVSFETEQATAAIQDQEQAVEADTEAFKALGQAIQRAEDLQLSFTRAAEDAALKLARQQEDVVRKTARQVGRLEERQAKDRDKLLRDQQKRLDEFEDNRRKQIASAEAGVAKERKQAAEDRLRQQRELQRRLVQAQERFNLSQLQSERRFRLSETRLRAEGDILAIQQLREDQELSRQEEAENFALSQKETKEDGKEKQKEQIKDFEKRIGNLKQNLEDQRAELLAGFDEQLVAQQQAQAEARANQERAFAEQAQDRAIALQREEEDRRISQQRQLEDLGRSLARQQGVTEEGVTAIAGEIEKVFGEAGVADAIIGGFSARTESEFKSLFDNIEGIVSSVKVPVGGGGFGPTAGLTGSPTSPLRFQEGGVVPGPIGKPQLAVVEGGETVLPTHKQNFIMPAPVVPSQTLSVEMSGGFNISGAEGTSESIIEAAIDEMTDTVRIAVGRIARRANG